MVLRLSEFGHVDMELSAMMEKRKERSLMMMIMMIMIGICQV